MDYEKDGILYLRLGRNRRIQQLTKSLPLFTDWRVPSRKTICLSNDEAQPIYDMLAPIFQSIHGYPLTPGTFPMEYRVYQPNSKGMDWHRDLQMYRPAQVEMVYTVFNHDANTRFEWKDRSGTIHSMQPKAGDLVMVKPNGPMHRVTGLGKGTRGILKIVGYPADATALPSKYLESSMCPRRGSSWMVWVLCGVLVCIIWLSIFWKFLA